jgi:hypothetical protein
VVGYRAAVTSRSIVALAAGSALGVVGATAAPAVAGPFTTVPSAADPGDPIDLHLTLDWELRLGRGQITRERVGIASVAPTDPIPEVRDLLLESSRHTLRAGAELGVFHDTWLSLGLPIVISDQRALLFDQQDTPCSFAGAGATCVNADNSPTVLDGLLPARGYDADDPGTGFPMGEDMIFRGPGRSGLTHVALGLGVAPMNQRRDDTKPTWKLGGELQLAIGTLARFDRDAPDASGGLSTGVHELRVYTSVGKRVGWAEPYVQIDWKTPLSAKSGSPFEDPGFGARRSLTMPEGSLLFGFEAIMVDRPDDHTRVSVDLSTEIRGYFEGRAHTPMWEVLAYAGDSRYGGPLILDRDPVMPDVQAISHPGISLVENYLELTARFAVRAELGPRVHLGAVGGLSFANDHTITFDDAGVDLPTCAGGSTGCEVEQNDLVNPGTAEVNPNHVPLVNLVGHRYRLEDALGVQVGVEARIMF